jgi:hypothetical protein
MVASYGATTPRNTFDGTMAALLSHLMISHFIYSTMS